MSDLRKRFSLDHLLPVENQPVKNETTFTIKCTMRTRWVPHFLAMLKYFQQLGSLGSSRNVTFYADGDGDFRPKFEWDSTLPSDAKPISEHGGDRTYDAG